MTDINFRAAKISEEDKVIHALEKFYGKSCFHGLEENYVNWAYKHNPYKTSFVEDDELPWFILEREQNILAVHNGIPGNSIHQNKEVATFWSTDWVNVSQEKGMGSYIQKELLHRCPLFLGYGCNRHSELYFKHKSSQYCFIDECPRYLMVLNAEKCIQLLESLSPLSSKSTSFIKSNELRLKKPSPFYLQNSLSGIGDSYWREHLQKFKMTIDKSPKYIKWRYLEHPYSNHYHLISSEPNSDLLACRIETETNTKLKVMRLLDWFPSQDPQNLLQALLSFASKREIAFIDFFNVTQSLDDELTTLGFLKAEDHLHLDIPRLFQPMERRKRKSINYVASSNVSSIHNNDLSYLYATKSDGDQDVFVHADYKTKIL